MAYVQKVTEEILNLPHVKTVGILGDPGCEGLGTYNMKVYAGALEESALCDVTLVVGDLVPTGTKSFYREIVGLTEILAGNPVYVLRGNHDTGEYEEFFGRRNYCILTAEFALVVLDNALRSFEEEGLSLLRRVLAREDVSAAIIAFHIPLPNRFIRNSVSEEEFERLKEAYAPFRDKVKGFVCGHVHSRFEDVADGIPLVCTGGAGALIEDVSEEIRACDVEHHIVTMKYENGKAEFAFRTLGEDCYSRERQNAILKEEVEKTVANELLAHLKYLMFAGRARKRGYERLAALFEALAESEYRHARNFLSAVELPGPFSEAPASFVAGERYEYEKKYRMLEEFAAEENAPVCAQAFADAAAAERVHAKLLERAETVTETVYVCPICGFVMSGEAPERCPVCGGPKKQFEAF